MTTTFDQSTSQLLAATCRAALDLICAGLPSQFAAGLYKALCVTFTLLGETEIAFSSLSLFALAICVSYQPDILLQREILS